MGGGGGEDNSGARREPRGPVRRGAAWRGSEGGTRGGKAQAWQQEARDA